MCMEIPIFQIGTERIPMKGQFGDITKEELCEQLQQAGFYTYKFYYLYPDPYQLKEVFIR